MIKVIVCGGCGKMGSKVAQLIYQNKDMGLMGIIESPSYPEIGKDWGMSVGLGNTGIIIKDNLEEIIPNSPIRKAPFNHNEWNYDLVIIRVNNIYIESPSSITH